MASWKPEYDICLTDSEDEENEFQRDFHGREAMLFVVDAHLYAERERFEQALMIIRGALLSGLLANDKDLMGILFANTAKNPDPFEPNCLENIVMPPNCAVFLPPRQLTKPIVEHFLRFLITAVMDFGNEYGVATAGHGSFSKMLRLCLNLFDNCGYKLNNATIVYLTDRNTPHPPESPEYQWAMQKAPDLEGKDIEFHVIPMVDNFDYEIFYKEFLTLIRDVELDSFVPPDSQQLREQLTDRKLRQDFLKRCLGHFKFSLGPNLDMSVQYYNYFRRRSYPRKVKILCKDNSIVKQKYKIIVRKQDCETMELSEGHEVKTSGGWYEINLGNMPIRITPQQIDRVRNLHAPGMMLLGFKPRSELPQNLYYMPSNFMYPDDQQVIGSKRLFRALWQRCLEREKIAVCLFMRKKKSIPRYVALMPVRASDSANDKSFRSLLLGDGFKIVYLPMAKHIRHTKFDDWNNIENASPEEGVELFQQVVKKLRIKYQPHLIKDPVLEKLQSNLLGLALDIKTENDGLTAMPDAEVQDQRIAHVLPKVDEIFGVDSELAKKRPNQGAGGSENASKTPKITITDEDIKRFDFVEDLIEKQLIGSCTVAQLRYILSQHYGVNMSKGTKQALIEEIYEQAKL